jgi:hypothetical protein
VGRTLNVNLLPLRREMMEVLPTPASPRKTTLSYSDEKELHGICYSDEKEDKFDDARIPA